jgi:hypothetical protein
MGDKVGSCVTGRCLCGQVVFEIENRFDDLFYCYCDRCRRVTGSAHVSNLFVADGELNWLHGQAEVATYTLPDTGFRNAFCRDCGSALPYVCLDERTVMVPAGALDDAPKFDRKSHIFTDEKVGWCPEGKGADGPSAASD